jgi:hypothetical protein
MFKSFARRRLIILLACLVIVGGGVFLFAGEDDWEDEPDQQGRLAEAEGIQIGDTAPDFELPRLTIEKDKVGNAVGKISAQKVKLSSFRGKKPVFLVFSSYT